MRTKDKIALIGFMGSGKSTVGPFLAEKIGWDFIDLDGLIEDETGNTISEIFETRGESHFRDLETGLLNKVKKRKKLILSCGGGIILKKANVKNLRDHFQVIYLEAPLDILKRRLSGSDERPLLKTGDADKRVEELYHSRREKYRSAADTIVNTGDLGVEEVVSRLLELTREAGGIGGERRLRVNLGGRSYPIVIDSDVLSKAGEYLEEIIGPEKKVVIISNDMVGPIYSARVIRSLEAAGFSVNYLEIGSGEEQKSLERAAFIYDKLLDFQVERDGALLALGGGVIGDLAGFAASTFMRGINYIQAPTSLLAQVDSGVGGKTAVNLPRSKNIVGSFYQPRLVLTDLSTLETLPARELRAGMAEVIKYGFLDGEELLGLIERGMDKILGGGFAELGEIVYRCCAFKADVVERDELDVSGVRAVLNYGHTVGHALEAVFGYQELIHGEAISIGMIAAAIIAERMGLIDRENVERHYKILTKAGLPTAYGDAAADIILSHMELDKKRKGARHRMVLLKGVGKAAVYDVEPELVKETLIALREEK